MTRRKWLLAFAAALSIAGFGAARAETTLVMDENWKAVLLAADPAVEVGGPPGPQGTLQAMQRERERVESIRRRAGCPLRVESNGQADDSVFGSGPSAWPFRLQQDGAGAARFVRRRCNLLEHLNGIRQNERTLPFATEPVAFPSLD